MACAFGPQLVCGFSGNLASLSNRDFGLALGTTVKSACILIHNRINKKLIISLLSLSVNIYMAEKHDWFEYKIMGVHGS